MACTVAADNVDHNMVSQEGNSIHYCNHQTNKKLTILRWKLPNWPLFTKQFDSTIRSHMQNIHYIRISITTSYKWFRRYHWRMYCVLALASVNQYYIRHDAVGTYYTSNLTILDSHQHNIYTWKQDMDLLYSSLHLSIVPYALWCLISHSYIIFCFAFLSPTLHWYT